MLAFTDRTEAGKRLADELKRLDLEHPLVLALPRGGVPVGYEVATELGCPLDTLVVRKIGAPFNPEFAVGAVGPHDVLILDDSSIAASGASRAAVEGTVGKEKEEMRRRVETYKSGSYSIGYIPKTVVLVDDGLATGLTARAALLSASARYPGAAFVFAAPVILAHSDKPLRDLGAEVVCLMRPKGLYAIGQAYENFPQVSDEEVLDLLGLARV